MKTTARIAIIGAGPGGLTCARVLQRHGIAVSVYDSDTSVSARSQGGTLDLHADTGQIALREAGLIDEFFALARPEGQSKRLLNRHGQVLSDHVAADGEDGAPEIDRGQLRALLADSLTAGTVHWNHKLVAVMPRGDATHRLTFENGTSVDVDLVIGADGAWSRVRPLMSSATPSYTGITVVESHFDDVDNRHPVVAELVRHGHVFISSDNKSLIGQRNSNHHIRVYIGMRTELQWDAAAGLDLADTAAVRHTLLRTFAGWDPSLLKMISDNDGPYVNRPLFVLPAPHTWSPTAGVTLLGDAAHLMSPFGGHGANLAMLDGAELALCLVRAATIDEAVASYEQVMLPRAATAAAGANRALDEFFTAGEFDPADLPDFDAERAQYKEGAAAYRAANKSSASQGERDAMSTPQELFTTRIAAKTRSAEAQKTVNAVYRFELSGPRGGAWIVDFTAGTAGVRQGDEAGQCTIAMTDDDFLAMLAGKFNPRMAFMNGKLKVKGDMGLAMKLGQVLAV